MFRRTDSVTIHDPGDDFSGGIDVQRLRAYGVAAVPAPANLWGLEFAPTRVVESVKLRTVEGEWVNL